MHYVLMTWQIKYFASWEQRPKTRGAFNSYAEAAAWVRANKPKSKAR